MQNKERLINLIKGLDDLKIIFEIPRLFISNYFNDLRNQIDLAAIRFLINKSKTQFKHQQVNDEFKLST